MWVEVVFMYSRFLSLLNRNRKQQQKQTFFMYRSDNKYIYFGSKRFISRIESCDGLWTITTNNSTRHARAPVRTHNIHATHTQTPHTHTHTHSHHTIRTQTYTHTHTHTNQRERGTHTHTHTHTRTHTHTDLLLLLHSLTPQSGRE